MIEKIEEDGQTLAIIVRKDFNKSGLNFVTEEDNSFQIGIHNTEKGKKYRAHKSLPFKKINVLSANKIYYIQEGKVSLELYNKKDEKMVAVTLNQGDLALMIREGHGVKMLKDTKMIEIKQGPYRGVEDDKIFIE